MAAEVWDRLATLEENQFLGLCKHPLGSQHLIKIVADLSVRPKRLTISNDDGSCNWAATAP